MTDLHLKMEDTLTTHGSARHSIRQLPSKDQPPRDRRTDPARRGRATRSAGSTTRRDPAGAVRAGRGSPCVAIPCRFAFVPQAAQPSEQTTTRLIDLHQFQHASPATPPRLRCALPSQRTPRCSAARLELRSNALPDPFRKADTSGGPAGTSRVRTHSHPENLARACYHRAIGQVVQVDGPRRIEAIRVLCGEPMCVRRPSLRRFIA